MVNAEHPADCFAAREAASLSGLSVAMVNYLCRIEIVRPGCDCKRGRGAKRHYAFGEVVALRLIARLSAAGVSVLRLKASLERLQKIHPEITLQSLPGKHVVTNGQEIFLHEPERPLERLLDGQFAFAFVVELSSLRKEVVEAIELRASA